MALGDTRKAPCEYCGGPAGECTEIRGGFLPENVCKKRPTYQDLWKEHKLLLSNMYEFQQDLITLSREVQELRERNEFLEKEYDRVRP
jgi:hypothetical protein